MHSMGNSSISISFSQNKTKGIYRWDIWVLVTLNMSMSFWDNTFSALFSNLDSNSKTAHRRAKRTKMWVSGVYQVCTWYLWPGTSYFGILCCTSLKIIAKLLLLDRSFFYKAPPMLCMVGFLTLCLSVCVSVCPLTKYLAKYWTDQLHFWWKPSLWPKEKNTRFWKKNRPEVRVGAGWGVAKIWP